MNGNENNDAIVEEENVASETSTVQSETPLSQRNRKTSKLAIFIALLALIITCLAIAFGAYFYKENQQLNNQQQATFDQLKEQIASQNTRSQKTLAIQSSLKTQLEQANLQLQQVNNASKLYKTDMQALQRAFSETQVRHPNDWILAEVEFMVKLAGRKIWLERDIPSAVALLLAADQRLVELNDASLSVLRSALVEDMNVLEALPKHDPDGLVLALSALERRVDKLLISGTATPAAAIKNDAKLSSDVNDWKENLNASWSSFLDSFIVINKRETQLQALLSPEQRWYLKENVRHDLAKAEFAIYREQQDIYDQALASATNFLTNYYDLNDSATKQFYESIQSLSKRKVSIDYPDQLKSAPVLERIIELRVKKSLASSRVEQE